MNPTWTQNISPLYKHFWMGEESWAALHIKINEVLKEWKNVQISNYQSTNF